MTDKFSSDKYFAKLDGLFRAANYLSCAQLYLLDNPLLRRPLEAKHIKKKIVGHWGTVPGQNFIYAHCNRIITKYDLDLLLISGPGHGGNFFIANSYLEGVYSEVYPEISQDEQGMTRHCKQFSFPGGVSSHVSPEVPGSIHEGGELGYSLAHGFGAVLDNPNLIATVIVGDGEAETGPLATSWHLNKFLNPKTDGVVLPILHLNGYKISNPTILARMSDEQLTQLFSGYGYKPYFVEGSDNMKMHKLMAKAMDSAVKDIQKIKKSETAQPIYPMIILRTPKGWTCPKHVDNVQIENSFRAHQVPVTMQKHEHIAILEQWLKSYRPYELFTPNYRLVPEIAEILPKGNKRISANIHANGGKVLIPLKTPRVEDYTVLVRRPGGVRTQDMLELGGYIRDLFKLNSANKNFRIFSPDEAMSNRLYKVFEAEQRTFNSKIYKTDEHLAPNGRIMDSFLSEHACEGMLEGYLLTGRHGMFNSYEAFARIVDSMIAQHAKWLTICKDLPWRAPISSLNLILTSNVWQQDHNGYTHQDPGLLDHLSSKTAEFVRMYLPPDANTLLYTYDACTKSQNKINIIVASKHPSFQWLSTQKAKAHVEQGLGIWDFACLNDAENPDIVLACCGDTPTLEALATVSLIKEFMPELNVRFVNIVDLMKLVSPEHHPHGLSDEEYNKIFTKNTPIIFNFHGYPRLIHQLTYKRQNKELHVSGYNEQGTITTPFDMRVRNKIDRYHLLQKILQYVTLPRGKKQQIQKIIEQKLLQHHEYIREYGIDMPEILEWEWK
ncbi:MAG: phosphoketolase family protein [Clostridia bacterium]|nr:phosphoketolase family protein [Clostridia bacterium]